MTTVCWRDIPSVTKCKCNIASFIISIRDETVLDTVFHELRDTGMTY